MPEISVPIAAALFPAIIEFFILTFRIPVGQNIPPPVKFAWLLHIVELTRLKVPVKSAAKQIPPPFELASLPLIVELIIVLLPEEPKYKPPPDELEVLS